ncbi:MAG: hypothetical protein ABFD83_00525 [Armatimonadota bacterium]
MRYRSVTSAIVLLLGLSLCGAAMATDWWASEVVGYSRLGQGGANNPYADPNAVLGKPSTWMWGSGAPNDPGICAVSMVCPAWNVAPNDGIHGNGEKLITSIMPAGRGNPAGYITVKFATPIYDDPDNWYGKDFEVYGNAFFVLGGSYVYAASNMEQMIFSAYGGDAIFIEPSPVSVSQDGVTWYTYSNGPYDDDYAPTQAFAWDWVENHWLLNSSGKEVELDFTRPVDPAWQPADYNYKSCAQAIDMYEGSGGGTAFDLAEIPDTWPKDANGRKWIQYIKVDGTGGEVDAFTRVSHQIAPTSIGEAKKLDDGTHVVLNDVVVSGETYSTGRFCYIQQSNRSSGIKLMGRVFVRGQKLRVYGDMDTINGEKVILATSVLTEKDEQGQDVTIDVKPLGMPNKAVAGNGLSTKDLLVRTWGKVTSVDVDTKSFVVDDGSGRKIKCIAPRTAPSESDAPNPGDPNWGVTAKSDFTPPAKDQFVTVTGISSVESDEQGGFVPVVRLRDGNDLQ